MWADQNHWQEWLNTFREWVVLQCLSRSEPLTRMSEHVSRLWVHSLMCEWFKTTDKRGITDWWSELFSGSWADQNHWQDWTCIQTVSSPSSVWGDQIQWWEWLNVYPVGEFDLHQNYWWKWLNMYLASEFTLQCLSKSELLMRMAEHGPRLWVYSL